MSQQNAPRVFEQANVPAHHTAPSTNTAPDRTSWQAGSASANQRHKMRLSDQYIRAQEALAEVKPGDPGFLVSCKGGHEDACAVELLDLIEAYLSKFYSPSLAAFQAHLDQGTGGPPLEAIPPHKPPQATLRGSSESLALTRMNSLLFLRLPKDVPPLELLGHVLADHREGNVRTEYILRVVPVEGCCEAGLEALKGLVEGMVRRAFPEGGKSKFAVLYHHHGGGASLKRLDVVRVVADLVPDSYKVDLKNPELCVLVDSFKDIIGASIVKDFHRLKNFNVHRLEEEEAPEMPVGKEHLGDAMPVSVEPVAVKEE